MWCKRVHSCVSVCSKKESKKETHIFGWERRERERKGVKIRKVGKGMLFLVIQAFLVLLKEPKK
jgi:hypothetical protein